MQAQGHVAQNYSRTPPPAPSAALPWQLQMYQKSLKKRQKVELLMRLMGQAGQAGSASAARCLLISGHDNNGAMNYQFRAAGGQCKLLLVDRNLLADVGQPVIVFVEIGWGLFRHVYLLMRP